MRNLASCETWFMEQWFDSESSSMELKSQMTIFKRYLKKQIPTFAQILRFWDVFFQCTPLPPLLSQWDKIWANVILHISHSVRESMLAMRNRWKIGALLDSINHVWMMNLIKGYIFPYCGWASVVEDLQDSSIFDQKLGIFGFYNNNFIFRFSTMTSLGHLDFLIDLNYELRFKKNCVW